MHNNMAKMIRQFSVASIRNFTSSANKLNKIREVKTLNKIMNGRDKSKSKWYTSNELPTITKASTLSNSHGQGKQSIRRISVLNKLFMKNITDLMVNGNASAEILGYGIQISRVKVAPDFRHINVYWLTSGTHVDAVIEKTLKRASGELRHELSQLRLMGEVPKIVFLKDRKLGSINEVDSILSVADYGDNYVLTDPTLQIRNELELQLNISESVKSKISSLEEDPSNSAQEEVLPEMQHNVLGLNHSEIMQSITQNLRKTKDAWSKYDQTQSDASES